MESRVAKNAMAALNDPASVQSMEDVPNIENAQAVNTET